MAKKASKKPAKPAAKAAGKPAGKAPKKPAAKPAPKSQSKDATKIVAKAEPKPVKKPAKQPAKPEAKKAAPKVAPKVTKEAIAIAEVKADPHAAKQNAKTKTTKAPKARAVEVTPETDGRPALKVHVHAGDMASDAPRGRSRKDSSGPTHNGISDAAVRKATGKGWAEWLELMDEAGCKAMDHKGIVAFLSETHATADWWSQMVTVGYEQARGMRQKNEKPDGFEAGVSKTINAATAKLYKAWEDEPTRERWMGEHKVEVRVANADKNIRMTWLVQGPDEGSSVEVSFWPKDANKCLVQVQQRKLSNADAVQRVRAFWSVKLENLRAMMEKA